MSSATEASVIRALGKKHSGQAWAFFSMVREKTGAGVSRTLDAMAMSLWPSRGLELHGFEIKVSRHDWKRELSKPAKAEAMASRVHRFWIAAPLGIVELEDLPPTWGLYEVDDKGQLFQSRPAPRLDPPEPTWLFLAAILRRSSEEKFGPIRDEAYEAGRKSGVASAKADAVAGCLLTLAQAAQRVSVPPSWLRREALAGRIPSLRIGRVLLFSASALERNLLERAERERASSATEGHDSEKLKRLEREVQAFEQVVGLKVRAVFEHEEPARLKKLGKAVHDLLAADTRQTVADQLREEIASHEFSISAMRRALEHIESVAEASAS